MIKPRIFLCGGVKPTAAESKGKSQTVVRLDISGNGANVNVRFEDVARVCAGSLSSRVLDLLDIAAYVYAADASTRRGTEWRIDGTLEPWGRNFSFRVAVRDPGFWTNIADSLSELLNFLSDDNYTFSFVSLAQVPPTENYLDFGDSADWPFQVPERVLMFSGGLDSLAGAIETAAESRRSILVSHRSVATLDSRQRRLFEELKKRFPGLFVHVPVWVNKDVRLGREHTQRTRSFLYAAIGAVIAEAVNAGGIRFFENGVVSLNLPIADEVLRARASRTTHPIGLSKLSDLLSLVTGRTLIVDNPYIFDTKKEVVDRIAKHGHLPLIGHTCSCAHTWFKSKTQWHCGCCSQCVDRRIAVVAAGLESFDPESDYVQDVFIGARKEGYDKNIAVDYVRHASELARMRPEEVAARFNLELSRAARCERKPTEVIQRLVDMHLRHGQTVMSTLESAVQKHASELVSGRLEPTSMLALIAGQQHLTPNWRRFALRIIDLLENGLPRATKSHKPKNESHLQEICDGILQAQDNDLTREFPFMRWSSSSTKPDWSAKGLALWIEAKYVKSSVDIRRITEDISSDITKYGDSGVTVLFVVFDPAHAIVDEGGFRAPVEARPGFLVGIIR